MASVRNQDDDPAIDPVIRIEDVVHPSTPTVDRDRIAYALDQLSRVAAGQALLHVIAVHGLTIEINQDAALGTARGFYIPALRRVVLARSVADDDIDVIAVTAHELQHYVDDVTGINTGCSLIGEIRANVTAARVMKQLGMVPEGYAVDEHGRMRTEREVSDAVARAYLGYSMAPATFGRDIPADPRSRPLMPKTEASVEGGRSDALIVLDNQDYLGKGDPFREQRGYYGSSSPGSRPAPMTTWT